MNFYEKVGLLFVILVINFGFHYGERIEGIILFFSLGIGVGGALFLFGHK